MAEQYKDNYIFDIEYSSGYYRELSPLFINFCLLANHIDPPDIDNDFTYCELGCGKAISLLIMAENYPNGEFYGIDFNPTHIKYGKYIAKKAGLTNIHFYNLSFSEACRKKSQFPKFNYIVFHGVYSWVSKKSRKDMVKFSNKKIKNGGVVYNSYNALPGSSDRSTIQKLLLEASHTSLNKSDIRMDHSIKIVDEFLKEEHINSKKSLIDIVESIKKQNRNYLPHEYLNLDWNACYFIDIEKKFSKKGMDFMNTCSPVDAFSSLVLPKHINNFLTKHFTPNTPIFEHFKDHVLNTSFRKDLYIKGIKKHSPYQIKKLLNKYTFIFKNPNQNIPKNIPYSLINIKLDEGIINHFSTKLKNGSHFNELIYQNNISTTLFYISIFISIAIVSIIPKSGAKKSSNLNKALCDDNILSHSFEFIASFKNKDGISLDLINRLFYKFYDENDIESIKDNAIDFFENDIQMKINNSKDKSKDYISERFKSWKKDELPVWKRIGVV